LGKAFSPRWLGSSQLKPETLALFSARAAKRERQQPSPDLSLRDREGETMIRNEFLRRYKPKAITILKVFGPVLLYQLIRMVLEYFHIPSLGIVEVLMAAGAALLVMALACWLWAVGEWGWFSLRRLRVFWRELWQFTREYWKASAAATTK